MKKYREIKKELEENRKALDEARAARKKADADHTAFYNSFYGNLRFTERKAKKENDPEAAEEDRLLDVLNKAAQAETRLEKISLILQDNARAALTAENLPIFIEIVNKYKGKKIGEKTRQKIYAEIKDTCNLGFYFGDGFQSLNFYTISDEGYKLGETITIYCNYEKHKGIFDEAGKFTGFEVSDFPIHQKYFDDPAAAVDRAEALKREIIETSEKLNELIKAYRAGTPDKEKKPDAVYLRF